MRFVLAFLAFLVALPIAAQKAPVPLRPADVAERAINGFIRPSTIDFAERAGELEFGLEDLCETPSAEILAEARARFIGALGSYARISFLRFGPLARDNRLERLWLWPDPRGIVLKQVQALLAAQSADALRPDALQSRSVALQGLSALEFVLFGTGAEALVTGDPFRCGYGYAVAVAIRRVAEAVALEWHDPAGISRRLIEPAAEDADYRSVREVLEELVGALSHGAEGIRDTQLLPFIGRDEEKPKPRSAPFWRSGGTVVLLAGGLTGIVDFVQASGIAEAAGEPGPFLANAVAFEGRNVLRAEAAVPGTMEEAVNDPRQLQGLRYFVVLTHSLQGLIGEQLSTALGLSVGFSSLDGD